MQNDLRTWPALNADYLASSKMSAGFFVIFPQVAERILQENNSNNRAISVNKLAQACADIEDGRFFINGESIIFADDGTLLDGQHRLAACAKTKIAIVSLCAFGIDREAMMTIDQGKARTAGDIVQLSGMPNGNSVAAIARLVVSYQQGDGSKLCHAREISTGKVMDYIRRNPQIVDIDRWSNPYQQDMKGICSRSILCAARIILEEKFGPCIVPYLHQVACGENLRAGDPAFAVRRSLWARRVTHASGLEAIFRGAVAYMKGSQLSRVSIRNALPSLDDAALHRHYEEAAE